MSTWQESVDLLNETHDFPTQIMFKVIGLNEVAFVARVVAAVREATGAEVDPPHRTRETPNGRHISVTLEPQIANAEMVLAVYSRLRTLDGVKLLM